MLRPTFSGAIPGGGGDTSIAHGLSAAPSGVNGTVHIESASAATVFIKSIDATSVVMTGAGGETFTIRCILFEGRRY